MPSSLSTRENLLGELEVLLLLTDDHEEELGSGGGGAAKYVDDTRIRQCVYALEEIGGMPGTLRALVWKSLLLEPHHNVVSLDRSVKQLMAFLAAPKLDEPNQRVIRGDVERTRANLGFFQSEEMRLEMEALLTYYCRSRNIRYKQGLNEVLAPFVFLREECPSLTVADSFLCFQNFVSKYLPTAFSDDEFISLQCSFHLFHHLLIYHDPTLSTFLAQYKVMPELYVTPWFLTVFASKTPMPTLLALWDRYIAEDDRFFYCFFGLALLLRRRSILLETDESQLPETLTKVTVLDSQDLEQVWKLAGELKRQTPTSFVHRLSATSQSGNAPVIPHLDQIEKDEAFLLLCSELLSHCYGLKGPNSAWKLVILDLRPKWQFDAGHLPLAIHVDKRGVWQEHLLSLCWDNFDLTSSPTTDSSALLTSSNDSSASSTIIQQPPGCSSNIINQDNKNRQAETIVKPTQHVCLVAGTADLRREALSFYNFLTNKLRMKYVSIAEGGFTRCHELVLKGDLDLIDHKVFQCHACTPTYRPLLKETPTPVPTLEDFPQLLPQLLPERSAGWTAVSSTIEGRMQAAACTNNNASFVSSLWLVAQSKVRSGIAAAHQQLSSAQQLPGEGIAFNNVSSADESVSPVRCREHDHFEKFLPLTVFTRLEQNEDTRLFNCHVENILYNPTWSAATPFSSFAHNSAPGDRGYRPHEFLAERKPATIIMVLPQEILCVQTLPPEMNAKAQDIRQKGSDDDDDGHDDSDGDDEQVDVYASCFLKDLLKVTSKRVSPHVLCFYFTNGPARPVLTLQFATERVAQDAIVDIRAKYMALKAKEKLKASTETSTLKN